MKNKIISMVIGALAVGGLAVAAPVAISAVAPETTAVASAWRPPPPGYNPCGYPGLPAYDRYGNFMYCWYR